MQWSVETRVPFLDPDVVSLALSMSLEHKLQPERKAVLQELVRRHVPAIAGRPKIGFGMDAAAFIEPAAKAEFLADGRLRDVLGQDAGAWRARLGALNPSQRLLYWSGEVWARLFLEGQGVDAVERDLWRDAAPRASAPVGQLADGAGGGPGVERGGLDVVEHH
jgi:asparagine synthetase B (glutamine-hydrolysing)